MKDILNELCSCMRDELSAFCFFDDENTKVLSGFFECRNVKAGEVLWKEGDALQKWATHDLYNPICNLLEPVPLSMNQSVVAMLME